MGTLTHCIHTTAMKLTAAIASTLALCQVQAAPPPAAATSPVGYHTMGSFMEKNFDWANFDQEVKNAVNQGYNQLYLGFYMALHGCQGACTAWRDLSPSTKQDVVNFLAQNGAQLVLSVGGPGEFIEGIIRDDKTKEFAQEAAQFAYDNGFMAIDFTTELSGSLTQPSVWATNGSYSEFISTCIIEAKNVGYTLNQISLTSPAQYFSPQFMECTDDQIVQDNCNISLSYFALNSRENQADAVGRINMDMLNEDENYKTYQYIFVNDDGFSDPFGYGEWGAGSAVQEVMNIGTDGNGPVSQTSGIDGVKIAIVKSQDEAESSVLNGYVAPESLANWGCQANNDFGWNGGFVGWTWNTQTSYETLTWPGLLNSDCSCLSSNSCQN